MRVQLELEALRHLDRARRRYAPHVVAPQVQQHHVLGQLLRIVPQLLGEALVLGGRAAARPRPRDRVHVDATLLDLHQQLRRGPDQRHLAELQQVHVRRGVDHPQRAIELDRVHARLAREALGDHRLNDVALHDVLLRPLHRPQVVRVRPVRLDRAARRPVERGVRQRRKRRIEAFHEPFDLGDRLLIGAVDVAVEARVRDHLDGVQHVVEDQQRIAEHQPRLRHAERVDRGLRDALEVPDRLVAEVAHRPPVEARQPGHGHRAELPQLRLHNVEWVAVLVLQRTDAVRLGADERVAPHPLAALDGLEQERERAARDLEVRRDRRLEVRAHLPVYRREVALAARREAVQLLAARGRRADHLRGHIRGHRRGPVRAAPWFPSPERHQRATRPSISSG